jgi:nicotinate phosphoribosyltransferase
VDTFRDEAEEAVGLAQSMGARLRGILLTTPPERGGVTADLVMEVRARLDLASLSHVEIFVGGEISPSHIKGFSDAGAPVNGYCVGSYIANTTPINFSGSQARAHPRPHS